LLEGSFFCPGFLVIFFVREKFESTGTNRFSVLQGLSEVQWLNLIKGQDDCRLGQKVQGFTTWELRAEDLQGMTMVIGQRNWLSCNIQTVDSFLLNQTI
jgi:hypothetical protein